MENNGNPKKRYDLETWVIIIQVRTEKETEWEENPMLGKFGLPVRKEHQIEKEHVVNRYRITEPTIVIPENCDVEKLEIIPIRKPLVLHTENYRRVLSPT